VKIDAESAGLDAARLARIDDHLIRRYLDPGKIAGCQVLVARHGHVGYFRSFGDQDRERGRPVADDTIWRIFSMTKPITGVALMSLYEHGHFQLDDPLHRFLPELAGLQVRERTEDGQRRLVEPRRPVSVRDVLMHLSGFGYETLMWGDRASGPTGDAMPPRAFLSSPDITLAGLIARLAERPLHHHPGTRWLYSVSTDVCGRLVEVISGRPFDEYLRSTLFGPLRMDDTDFSVPDGKIDRLAAMYQRNRDKQLRLAEDPYESRFRTPPTFLSGGGGLVSTSADYLRFCQMLLNGGELDGVRVLGRKTVELMTRNHLPGGAALSSLARGFGEVRFTGTGFGLTVAVDLGEVATGVIGSAGSYSWGGAASTVFWIDPAEDLIVVFMVQLLPSGTFGFRPQLQTLVYPAIVD
jgi:CubicO group peptidase (beta-lactamase class C family)